jgi:hypothetical protein
MSRGQRQSTGRLQLERLRIQAQHGDAQVPRYAPRDAGRDAPQHLEQRAFAERQLEAEGRVAGHERPVALRDGAVDQATEHRRVRDGRDDRDDERADDERIGDRAAGEAGDDLVGDDAADALVVQRRRHAGRELTVVDERRVGVPRDRRAGEQQRRQDDHEKGGRPAHAHTVERSPRMRPAVASATSGWDHRQRGSDVGAVSRPGGA